MMNIQSKAKSRMDRNVNRYLSILQRVYNSWGLKILFVFYLYLIFCVYLSIYTSLYDYEDISFLKACIVVPSYFIGQLLCLPGDMIMGAIPNLSRGVYLFILWGSGLTFATSGVAVIYYLHFLYTNKT